MKPNFALSLSFEGIRLLHRAAGGWRIVGDVALDADDIAAELVALRKSASDLEPGGVRTKLIIPAGQIKYLTIDTMGLSDAARRKAAEAALDGATPYAVADLAYDISNDGAKTHIAAVARETLAEAEDFAQEHRFHPVSFVAIPGDESYLGEPFFGPSSAAPSLLEDGQTVEADGIAVVVVGDVEAPAAPQMADADSVEKTDVSDTDATAVLADEPAEDAEMQDDTPEDDTPEGDTAEDDTAEDDTAKDDTGLSAEENPKDPVTEPPQIADAPETEAVPKADEADADADAEPTKPAIETPKASEPVTPDAAAASIAPAPPAPSAGFASRRGDAKAPVKTLVGETRAAPLRQVQATGGQDATAKPDTAKPASVETDGAAPPNAKAKAGFLSRRKAAPVPAPETARGPQVDAPRTEADRMTVFGARKGAEVGGKPRFLGLVMTVVLLVFLAGVAAWASVFMDDGLARFFGNRAPTATAAFDPDSLPAPRVIPKDAGTEQPDVRTASLDPGLTEEDSAVLDALRDPVVAVIPELTPQELEAKYAVTGIWARAPDMPSVPTTIPIDDLYITSIDPISTSNDAIALPNIAALNSDISPTALSSPAAAGTQFALDTRGLVVPTVQGTLSPDGITVFLGKPPLVPPATRARLPEPATSDAPDTTLVGFRPRLRPGDLAEKTERAQLDGLTRGELADFRPKRRPKSIQQIAAAAAKAEEEAAEAAQAVEDEEPEEVSPFAGGTKFAAQQSKRPDTRPRNFARVVKRAQRNRQNQQAKAAATETRTTSARTVAPRTVTPKIPSKTSVAKQATVRNAINLRKVNLIGVYGKPSRRRALVRLANGRYKKVVVGDRIDGGRVSAIGNSELRYTKRGRSVVLKMPRG